MASLDSSIETSGQASGPGLPSGVITASGQSAAVSIRTPARWLRLQLNVTAASGTTPSLTVTPQDSVDGGATWNDLTAFTAATGVTRQVINIPAPFGALLRFNYAVSGTTPSFTFQIDGITR